MFSKSGLTDEQMKYVATMIATKSYEDVQEILPNLTKEQYDQMRDLMGIKG